MSDAASLLTGAPAPAPSDGGAPAAPAAPSAPAAPAPAPGDGSAPAAPAPAATWLDALDDDGKKFVEARGFQSPADALKALRESAAPETPDAYEIPVPDGEDPAFAKSVAPLMHKAGLSPAQAKTLAEGWNQMQAAQRQAAIEAQEAYEREAGALAEREEADLRREWGASFDAQSEHGRRAVAQFIPGDTAQKQKVAQAMEQVIGYAGMMRMWSSIGKLIGEDAAHGLGQAPGGRVTPQTMYEKSNMNP